MKKKKFEKVRGEGEYGLLVILWCVYSIIAPLLALGFAINYSWKSGFFLLIGFNILCFVISYFLSRGKAYYEEV